MAAGDTSSFPAPLEAPCQPRRPPRARHPPGASLYRWSAQRGTIITTAAFSKGARKAAFDIGAAPIQLIDGDRLVELLIENGIGVKQQPVKLWRFDAESFEGVLEGDEEG